MEYRNMESGALVYNSKNADAEGGSLTYRKGALLENVKEPKPFKELSDTDRRDLVSYLNSLGLVYETGMLVIPSTRHYFYDAEDLKGVKTVINLKQMNHIREMKEFLQTISELMPRKSTFVGCFTDNRLQNGFSDRYNNRPEQRSEKDEFYENGIESRIPFINRMYSFIDSRTNRHLTGRGVTRLLEECGLKISGMKELNGMTYFCARKESPAA